MHKVTTIIYPRGLDSTTRPLCVIMYYIKVRNTSEFETGMNMVVVGLGRVGWAARLKTAFILHIVQSANTYLPNG